MLAAVLPPVFEGCECEVDFFSSCFLLSLRLPTTPFTSPFASPLRPGFGFGFVGACFGGVGEEGVGADFFFDETPVVVAPRGSFFAERLER